jgi:glycosyltransferase involved in cell wall biosynthesis
MTTELAGTFKPWYTWPNKSIHFKQWYTSSNCRIFLIENITHNWDWLSKYAEKIRTTDYFFVQLGWHYHHQFVEHCEAALQALKINKDQFRIMYPDFASKGLFEYHGFKGDIINHNCFLDWNQFQVINKEKIYDAIYLARFAPFKRHELCAEVPNLALVAGNAWGQVNDYIPPHTYINEKPLAVNEVSEKIAESHVGLILSEAEGACFSSSEYLLSGIPVVSTISAGGRDIWYNDYNSIVCAPNADAIRSAVAELKSRNRNPQMIRDIHVNLSKSMRQSFIKMHKEICAINGEEHFNTEEYFVNNFKHKLLDNYEPDFEGIFLA